MCAKSREILLVCGMGCPKWPMVEPPWGVLGPIQQVGRRCGEYPLVQDTVSSPLNRSSSWGHSSILPNYSSSSVAGLEKLVQQIFPSSILRIAEVNPNSLHVVYPRSPFKVPTFINALLFLCHSPSLKLFPSGNVLLHPSSNAGLHSRYLLHPSSNAGLYIRAPTPKYI